MEYEAIPIAACQGAVPVCLIFAILMQWERFQLRCDEDGALTVAKVTIESVEDRY